MEIQADSHPAAGAAGTARPTGVRHGVLGLLALAAASAYLTRHCIAVANTTIQKELQFTTEQMGWILSAFMVGYLAFQVPGGWLGTRLGPRRAFALISLLWSLFNLWSAQGGCLSSHAGLAGGLRRLPGRTGAHGHPGHQRLVPGKAPAGLQQRQRGDLHVHRRHRHHGIDGFPDGALPLAGGLRPLHLGRRRLGGGLSSATSATTPANTPG